MGMVTFLLAELLQTAAVGTLLKLSIHEEQYVMRQLLPPLFSSLLVSMNLREISLLGGYKVKEV